MNKRKPFYRHRLKRDLVEVISLFLLILLTACGSEWEYADPEAHEKTEQLQQEYNAKLQGSWHREVVNSDHRFFERITFKADQTYTLYRVWKMRQGDEWEDFPEPSAIGESTGTWSLYWERLNTKEGQNILALSNKVSGTLLRFIDIINDQLLVEGVPYLPIDEPTVYERGEGTPSF